MHRTGIELQPATLKHLEEMARLHTETFLHEPWSAGFMEKLLRRTGAFGLIAQAPSPSPPLFGFTIAQQALDEAEILTITVGRKHQRTGIGGMLLDRLVNDMKNRGVKTLFLDVATDNHPALALYHSRDFLECGLRRNYYRNGTDAQLMAKNLAL